MWHTRKNSFGFEDLVGNIYVWHLEFLSETLKLSSIYFSFYFVLGVLNSVQMIISVGKIYFRQFWIDILDITTDRVKINDFDYLI